MMSIYFMPPVLKDVKSCKYLFSILLASTVFAIGTLCTCKYVSAFFLSEVKTIALFIVTLTKFAELPFIFYVNFCTIENITMHTNLIHVQGLIHTARDWGPGQVQGTVLGLMGPNKCIEMFILVWNRERNLIQCLLLCQSCSLDLSFSCSRAVWISH